MNENFQTFFNIIKSYLHGTALPTGLNWGAAFAFAKNHSLGNLFYLAVKNSAEIPAEVKGQMKAHFMANVAQQISQEYYAGEIFARLDEKGIKYLPLKGYVMRGLYPTPEARTSCDIDVFYDKSRREEVEEILSGFGFENHSDSANHGEWVKDEITVENHHELAANNGVYHEYYQGVWQRLNLVSGSQYVFSDEDYYIYLMVHAAKHFAHGGFGVRTVLDFYVYNQAKQLDREYLKTEFEKLQLTKFADEMEKLANVWFGDATADENSEFIGEYILKSGTYGLTTNSTAINSASANGSVKSAKKRYWFKTLFPSYKNMCQPYPVLKKAAILLPVMWVYRWFDVLFTRRKNVKAAMDRMKTLDEKSVDTAAKLLEITQVPID